MLALSPAAAARSPLLVEAVIERRLADSDAPACVAVGVVDHDETRIFRGCTPDAGPAAFDDDSLFEIGSITKGLAGLLLADMVLKGEIRIEDTAAEHSRPGAKLPAFEGRPVTLRHLVTHTAGLPRMPPGFAPKDWRNPYADFGVDDLYAALAATRLQVPPGLTRSYSNFGFMWLSEILSRVGGKPFDVLLTERVLLPLGMGSARVRVPPGSESKLVGGHDLAYRPTSRWDDVPELSGVGGLRASISDMVKLAQALSGARATPIDAVIAKALEPLHRLGDLESHVGYAWMQHEAHRRVHWHGGGSGGFSAMLVVDRGSKTGAVVLADSVARFDDLARHIVDPSQPLVTRVVASGLEEELRREYLGRYELSRSFAIEVFARGKRLYGQATDQAPLELWPLKKDLFSVTGVDARLRFERDPAGRVTRLVLIQGGRERPGSRLPDAAAD